MVPTEIYEVTEEWVLNEEITEYRKEIKRLTLANEALTDLVSARMRVGGEEERTFVKEFIDAKTPE